MQNKNEKGSFAHDLCFLQKHDSVIVLQSDQSKVIVSTKYQGKVFTSTSDGNNSFGWIHYSAFDAPLDPHMNAYGGENRLWLGPEGGKFSLFFHKDSKMEFANWKTPAAFDSEPWMIKEKNETTVALQKEMQLTNYTGTELKLLVNRKIQILDKASINLKLQINLENGVKAVGYQTENSLTNTGTFAWNDTTGMPCLWMLDMLNPSDHTTVIIPYTVKPNTNPATTDYFGEISPDRIKYENAVLFFKADGKSRGKLGIKPACAKNIAGSYDSDKKVLTITLFDIDNNDKYLNQEWNATKAPFSGDAVNAYNDGPLADGKQMGPFYEIESVSPAAFLKPGETLSHQHSVFHFTGDEKGLNAIVQKLLGVSLEQVKKIFP
ncbi:MAG: DUF6786 family protein [Bacteroidota bacterium]